MARANTPVRFKTPRKMSMNPTDNSMLSPSRGGMLSLKSIIAEPTAKMVSVCPTPQSAPIIAAWRTVRSRLTMVVTATT